TRWHRELHHLVHGPWIDPEPAGRRTLAQALNANRMPHLQIEIHVLHPPPPADSRQKAICCRSFTPALPEDPAASMRDYCSGAYINVLFRSAPWKSRLFRAPWQHVTALARWLVTARGPARQHPSDGMPLVPA